MYFGNEMRYLNHKGPKTEEKDNDSLPRPEANCSGKGKCDHHIVSFLLITDQLYMSIIFTKFYSTQASPIINLLYSLTAQTYLRISN